MTKNRISTFFICSCSANRLWQAKRFFRCSCQRCKITHSKETSIADTAASEDSEEVSPKTWRAEADRIKFNIDFRESPQTSFGIGYIENQNDIALVVGTAWQATQ